MKNTILCIVIFFCVTGCNQQNEKAETNSLVDTIASDSMNNKIEKTKNILSEKSLFAGSDTLTFNLKMDSLNQSITVPVYVSSEGKIGAAVYSQDTNANIRIAQIGYPDSTFDGPFGRGIIFEVKDTGEYKIRVAENMMAGDKWFGDFNLKVWLDD